MSVHLKDTTQSWLQVLDLASDQAGNRFDFRSKTQLEQQLPAQKARGSREQDVEAFDL